MIDPKVGPSDRVQTLNATLPKLETHPSQTTKQLESPPGQGKDPQSSESRDILDINHAEARPAPLITSEAAQEIRRRLDNENYASDDKQYASYLDNHTPMSPVSKILARMDNLTKYRSDSVKTFLENVVPDLNKLDVTDKHVALQGFFSDGEVGKAMSNRLQIDEDSRKKFLEINQPPSISLLVEKFNDIRFKNLPKEIRTSDLFRFFIDLVQSLQKTGK
jgi:hypothetical protein